MNGTRTISRRSWLRAAAVAACALCAPSLGSCDDFHNRYSKSELDRLLTKAEPIVQSWVDGNMPGGTISNLCAHTYDIVSGPSFLTDYVDFTVAFDGADRELMMNTVTGEVYEDTEAIPLCEAVTRQLPEWLGIAEGAHAECVMAWLFVPYSAECASDKADIVGMCVRMLPYGTGDLDAFVANVAERPLIEVSISGEGPEMAAVHDLSDVYALKDRCGLYVDLLNFGDANYYFDMYNDGSLDVYHKSWYEIGDFAVYLRDYELKQSGDISAGDVMTEEESRFDPTNDMIVEATEEGYRFTRPDGVVMGSYCIGAPLGSPALESDYRALILDEEGTSENLTWDMETYEYPTLVDRNGDSFKTHYEVDLVRTGAAE